MEKQGNLKMSEENLPEGNVIKGPWEKKSLIKIPDEDWMEIQENLKFADDLTEGVVVQLIHTLSENGIDVSGKEFIKDTGFLIETVKSQILRHMGYKHPMQAIVKGVMMAKEEEGGHLTTECNMDVVELIAKDMEFKDDDIS